MSKIVVVTKDSAETNQPVGWVDMANFMDELSSIDAAADAGPAIVVNETIFHLPNYDGHWKGGAYQTYHTYGIQIHRTREDAERWNVQQKAIRPARD